MSVRFVSRVEEVERRLDAGVRRGLFLAANDIKNAAQRLAPVDTGFLRGTITAIVGPDSGTVTGGTRDAQTQASVTIPKHSAVVGTGAEYAPAVHERHATQSKFLETPARQIQREIRTRLADELRKAMR